MKSIIYLCPTADNRPTGGIKVIYKHADLINFLNVKGLSSEVLHFQDLNFRCTWFENNTRLKNDLNFDIGKNFVIIPEVLALHLVRDLNMKVQNMEYSFRFNI